MKRPVGVAELKAKLSEYLRAARSGKEVTILDRERPVAKLVPISTQGTLIVREPITRYRTLGDVPMPPPLRLAADPVQLLLDDRARER